jgi:hypothetical protein
MDSDGRAESPDEYFKWCDKCDDAYATETLSSFYFPDRQLCAECYELITDEG